MSNFGVHFSRDGQLSYSINGRDISPLKYKDKILPLLECKADELERQLNSIKRQIESVKGIK